MGEISRRSLLRTAAWATPAVAAAAAMPLAAASTPTQFQIDQAYAGWVDVRGWFAMEAYVLKDGVPSSGDTVTFTLVPSGATFQAVSAPSTGLAVVLLTSGELPLDTIQCLITVGDAQETVDVTSMPPT